MDGNNIENIEGIENLNNLWYIDLSNNNIKSLDGLYVLKSIDYIDNINLMNNPIEEISERDYEYLKSIGLTEDFLFYQMVENGQIRLLDYK